MLNPSISLRWIVSVLGLAVCAHAASPALRDEVSLNGTWSTGGTVPEYNGRTISGTTTYTYERTVSVPSAWSGKRIKLDFKAVNWIAKVYVNGTLVTTHLGAWIPFTVDITDNVTAGTSFVLRVDVQGSLAPPIQGTNGAAAWPIGPLYNDGRYSGIIDNVYLRAYGSVHITDAFIKTSVRTATLTVEYTIVNNSTSTHTVTVAGAVTPATGGGAVKSLQSRSVTIAAGATDTVWASVAWADAHRWNPEDPYLYHIVSSVKENGSTLDSETRRFGFREIWTNKNTYILNGTRVNLRGDNISFEEGGRSALCGPTQFPGLIDTLKKKFNFNVIRFHRYAGPSYLFDIADEKGFMFIVESALYGRDYLFGIDRTVYMNNTLNNWIEPWVKSWRNRTCVIQWSGSNEMAINSVGTSYTFGILSLDQLISVGLKIQQYDKTRPVVFDGEGIMNWPVINLHYPEGYTASTSGSIYSWANKVFADKPTGVGEFLTSYDVNGAANRWWQGTWVRGMRYVDFADIRPYVLNWVWGGGSAANITNIEKSYASVALFDKAYDDLGINPVMNGAYPSVAAGSTANRTLILYNDEFSGEVVTVTVEAKSGSTTYASATKTYALTLGEHMDIPCSFQVPYVGGGTFDLVLSTSKGGVQKFIEAKRFNVSGASSGASSSTISLGGSSVDPSKPFLTVNPSALSFECDSGAAPLNGTLIISNASIGALASVTTRVAYASVSGWVSLTAGGSGNLQSLRVAAGSPALAPGTYAATIIIKSAGAAPDSVVVPVALVVNAVGRGAVNAGGDAAGYFSADRYYSGGTSFTTATAVTITGVANAAPAAVYQSERWGNISYTLPSCIPGHTYTVRLHFAELYWTATGQRTFNVDINGTRVLSSFDIFTEANGAFKAVVRDFRATANSQGQIVIGFAGIVDNAKISGIEWFNADQVGIGTVPRSSRAVSLSQQLVVYDLAGRRIGMLASAARRALQPGAARGVRIVGSRAAGGARCVVVTQ